ncbi:MAG: response regulator [Pseudomonadota bacterium]
MLKILIIDDEKPTLAMFRLFLSAYGYQVDTAETGEIGLKIFREKKPDIVFTDLKMPGMDGLEVMNQIRQSSIPSQVIVITGHGDMEKAINALDLDAADFINKPVERQALDAALLRAERRMDYVASPRMDLKHEFHNHNLDMEIGGNINETSMEIFSAIMKLSEIRTINEVSIRFDTNFSINRQGIASLISFLQFLKTSGAHIRLKGLSYNFRIIFKMVGIHRAADFDLD